MNTNRVVIIGALVVVVGLGAALLFGGFSTSTPSEESSTLGETYRSDAQGLAFEYPNEYLLSEYDTELDGRAVHQITLLEKTEAPRGEGTEGPPAITIQVVPKPEKITLEGWVRNNNLFTNFNLSPNGVLTPSLIAGAPGFTYTHSGLYETDVSITEYKGKVYIFSAGWLTAEDSIRRDLQDILKTVTLI